jgi:hypothetical protein
VVPSESTRVDLEWSVYAGALIGFVVAWVVPEALFDVDWIPSVAHAAFYGVLAGLWGCALLRWTAGAEWRRRSLKWGLIMIVIIWVLITIAPLS